MSALLVKPKPPLTEASVSNKGIQDSQHEGIVRLWFDSPERAARSPDGLWLTASSPLLTTVPPRGGQLSSGSGS